MAELVSPRNKDRDEARQAFIAKCGAAYLQRGLGLVVVDIVTSRQADFYAALVQFLQQPEQRGCRRVRACTPPPTGPSAGRRRTRSNVWLTPLALGQPLPLLPLALLGGGCVPLDLEATYTLACERSRL